MDSENTEPTTQADESSCTSCGHSPPSTFELCLKCMEEQVRFSNEIIAEIIAEEKKGGGVVSNPKLVLTPRVKMKDGRPYPALQVEWVPYTELKTASATYKLAAYLSDMVVANGVRATVMATDYLGEIWLSCEMNELAKCTTFIRQAAEEYARSRNLPSNRHGVKVEGLIERTDRDYQATMDARQSLKEAE
jgi:hypothetical protein